MDEYRKKRLTLCYISLLQPISGIFWAAKSGVQIFAACRDFPSPCKNFLSPSHELFKNFEYQMLCKKMSFDKHGKKFSTASSDFLGCKAFGQLEFWHRALSAYENLSIGFLAYGILSIALLAYCILAMHLSWHSQIVSTAWTFNCVNYCSITFDLVLSPGVNV